MLRLELPRYKKIESISKTTPDSISFSQGTIRVGGTPKPIKDFIAQLLMGDTVDYYQDGFGLASLREKIASDLSRKHKISLERENILVTHGALGSITNICLTLLKEGEEVIIPVPNYPSYRNIVHFSKAKPNFVHAFVEQDGQWILDVEKIHQAITAKTKMVMLSNPSNPCGVCLPKATVLALKDLCESYGIYLLLDEVYDNYIYETEFFSGTSLTQSSPFVIRTGSFSKDFSMSGWRVGFTVASADLISQFGAVQDGAICCPSVISQHAALFALEHPELIQPQVHAVQESLQIACELLTPLVDKGLFSYIKPQAGIFLFIKTREEDCELLIMDILDKAKVALVPGKDFGGRADSFRLCFARNPELLRTGMRRLQNYFIK
ncbi:MAG: pyridoxal phosphate-dependent aminotransferase [Rhabdochlamydiaceae bacterium]|nr:pyridoxal phosphate-dependent aminotransferase [Rhabdochlamydiaceae bacterium]